MKLIFSFLLLFFISVSRLFAVDYSSDPSFVNASAISTGDTVNAVSLYISGGDLGGDLAGIVDGTGVVNTNGDINTGNYSIGTVTNRVQRVIVGNGNHLNLNGSGGLNASDEIRVLQSGSQLTVGGSANINATNIRLDSTNILTIQGDANITATINGYDATEGTINIEGNFSTQANIGSTNGLSNLNITASDAVLTINNNIKSTDINNTGTITVSNGSTITGTMTNTGTLNLGSGQVSGAISGSSGTVNFTDNYTTANAVEAQSISISSAKTLTANHTLTIQDILLKSDGTNHATLSSALDSNISGNITTEINSKGILDFDGTTIISGDVGDANKSISSIDMATGKALALNGSSYVDTITLNGTSSLTLGGSLDGNISAGTGFLDINSQAIVGTISKSGAGDINISTGTVSGEIIASLANVNYTGTTSTSSKITATTITVADTKVLTLGSDLNVSSGITLQGSGQISTTTDLTIIGNIDGTVANSSKLNIDSNVTINGTIGANYKQDINISANNTLTTTGAISADDVTLTSSSKIVTSADDVNITAMSIEASALEEGVNYTLIDTGSANITIGSVDINSTDMLKYTTSNSSGKYNIRLDYATAQQLNLSLNSASVYGSFKKIMQNDADVFNEVKTMNAAQLDEAFTTLNPELSSASVSSGFVSSVASTISSHIKVAHINNSGESGISTGDSSLNTIVWGKYFDSRSDQNDKGGVSGYDTSGNGVVFGIEKFIDNTTLWGAAISRGDSLIESKNSVSKAKTNIRATTLSAYISKDYDRYNVECIVSYSFNKNSGSRHVVIGSLDKIANSSYDSKILSSTVKSEYYMMSKNGYKLKPYGSLSYSKIYTDSYDETGAGSFNLNVNADDMEKIVATVGIKAKKDYLYKDYIFTPEYSLGYSRELGDEYATSSSSFIGGNTTFETKGLAHNRSSLVYSLGVNCKSPSKTWEVSANIDGKLARGYRSYTSMASIKIKF